MNPDDSPDNHERRRFWLLLGVLLLSLALAWFVTSRFTTVLDRQFADSVGRSAYATLKSTHV